MAAWPDRQTGYVEVKGGPACGRNCKYFQASNSFCTLPVVSKQVSPQDGCCSYWDDGSGKPGIMPPPRPDPNATLAALLGR